MIEKMMQEMTDTGHHHWAKAVAALQSENAELRKASLPASDLVASAAAMDEDLFTISSGGRDFPNMRLVATCDHFRKFKDPAGRSIILADRGQPFSNVVNMATGKPIYVHHTIVMASREIVREICNAAQSEV